MGSLPHTNISTECYAKLCKLTLPINVVLYWMKPFDEPFRFKRFKRVQQQQQWCDWCWRNAIGKLMISARGSSRREGSLIKATLGSCEDYEDCHLSLQTSSGKAQFVIHGERYATCTNFHKIVIDCCCCLPTFENMKGWIIFFSKLCSLRCMLQNPKMNVEPVPNMNNQKNFLQWLCCFFFMISQ